MQGGSSAAAEGRGRCKWDSFLNCQAFGDLDKIADAWN